MRVYDVAQGTPDWHAVRRGHITASRAADAMAAPGTKRRTEYAMELALDLEGVESFDDVEAPPWFEHGKENEARARAWYEWETEHDVQQIGFATAAPPWDFLGASPDGLVGSQGVLEIKSRRTLRAWKKATTRGEPLADKRQTQLQLFVLERSYTDYVNHWHWPEQELEEGHIRRAERDQAYIDDMLEGLALFWREVLRLAQERQKLAPRR